MNWKDLIGQNFSRKLGIATITIIALVYLGTAQQQDSQAINPNIHQIALYVTIIGAWGIFTQGFLDFFKQRKSKPKLAAVVAETEPKIEEETPIERNQT